MGRFGQCNGPFWTIFLEIKIFGAVLAMGRFGIDPYSCTPFTSCRGSNFIYACGCCVLRPVEF